MCFELFQTSRVACKGQVAAFWSEVTVGVRVVAGVLDALPSKSELM